MSLLKKMMEKLPASWKGYLVSAAAGYAGAQYGPAAKAAVQCIAQHFG